MYGYIPVDRPPGLWGGYAEYQYLGPDAIVHRVPDGLDPVVATLFNPLGAGVRWARHRARHRPGASWPCSARACGAWRRPRRRRTPAPAFVMVTGRGPRDVERLAARR